MKVEITTLVENTLGEHHQLRSEHGLSFLVKAGNATILFDTGASSRFIHNAELLAMDLKAVDQVLISHGHYDHSGGYKAFVDQAFNRDARLVVKPGFFNKKYGVNGNHSEFLGNGFTREELVAAGVSIEIVHDHVKEVAPGVFSVSGFERTCPMEQLNPRFRIERDGAEVIDEFCDEQVMVVKSEKGLVVVLGCSHPGLINILNSIKGRFEEDIHGVIGGTHLVEANQERLEKTMDFLLDQDIPVIGISHCSGGADRLDYIKSRLGSRFFHNSTGTRFAV
ncbi:MAG: MBL fold metallo-hydrolase [Desulfobacteraceae bacterium]|nr:MBL fold metallo-hydrolase [Desulfobacteraceae bacterium]